MMRIILNLFVLITGASGLIYQVAWQKYLSRLLGSDSIATAIILGTFLGGLSLGYYLCGRLTLSARNPFKTYAVLEGVIGLWGLAFPFTFKLAEIATQSWSFAYPVPIVVQGLLCSLALTAVPTICMGGTIPILTQGLSQDLTGATRTHAGIYAVNTAGAFVGTLLAGFFLVPELGLPGSVRIAAVLNLAAAAFFLSGAPFAAIRSPRPEASPQDVSARSSSQEAPLRHGPSMRILYVIAFLSGFYVMTLENALIRLTNLSFGSSSYSFTIIVAVFILLIAVGSFLINRLQRLPDYTLCVAQILITLSLLVVYITMDQWPYLAHLIRIACQSNLPGMALYYSVAFGLICLLLFIPVACAGATLPIVFHQIKNNLRHIGRHAGNIFSFNTLGSLAGCLLGGILFYSFLDIQEIFMLAVCLAAVSAWLASRPLGHGFFYVSFTLALAVVIVSLATPWYDQNHFKLGTFRERVPLPYSFDGPRRFFDKFTGDKAMNLYDDDTVGTVSVLSFDASVQGRPGPRSKAMSIVVNGKSDSATYESTVRLLAHVPALLAPHKAHTLVVGLGTGVTAGELSLYPEVRSLDVAEISPTVIEALPLFAPYNQRVHQDTRLNILRGDAFNLLKGRPKTYDLIISEPSNPWVTGVDALFSKEFYALVQKRLDDDGVFAQWLHFYEASPEMLGIVANTLAQSFRYCRAFVVGDEADLIFLCSHRDLSLDQILAAETTFQTNPRVSRSLRSTGIRTIEQLLVREIWSPAYVSANFPAYPAQTLDHPILHYLAGRDFFRGRLVPIEFIFDQKTANFSDDFLLAQKYPEWRNFERHADLVSQLIHGLGQAEYLKPIQRSLSLRAHFNNPAGAGLPPQLANDPVLTIIPLITGTSQDPGVWQQVGMQTAPFPIKGEKLFEIVSRTRNWIVPYPLEGLKRFLMQGIRTAKNPFEKNWAVLHFCRILLEEQADSNQVKAVFNMTVKDQDRQVMIRSQDRELLARIQKRLGSD